MVRWVELNALIKGYGWVSTWDGRLRLAVVEGDERVGGTGGVGEQARDQHLCHYATGSVTE